MNNMQSIKTGNDPDSIFEAWFSSMNLNVSREDAKIIYDAGVSVGKCASLMMPAMSNSHLRVYQQPAIAKEEKLLLTA